MSMWTISLFDYKVISFWLSMGSGVLMVCLILDLMTNIGEKFVFL